MATEPLHLTRLIQAVSGVLNAFNFPIGSSILERAATNLDNDPNNVQFLANIKQELTQLPSLSTIDMNDEMRCFVQALIDSIKATNVIEKKFITRSVNKLYRGFEPFARNEVQHAALIEMQTAKEDVLGVELRHRMGHKQSNQSKTWQGEGEEEDDDPETTPALQAGGY